MPKNAASTRANLKNALSIGSMGFLLAVIFSGPIGTILQEVGPLTAAFIVLATIAVAILADILAIAATVGDDAPLNAMASDRVPGAKEALILVRNAGRVNSIFSDVVGDVAGTMTGVLATPIIYGIREAYPTVPSSVASMLVIGVIAFLTIGGKAAEKAFAVKASTSIILGVGKGLYYTKRFFGWTGTLPKRRRPRSNGGPRGRRSGNEGPDPGSGTRRRTRPGQNGDANGNARPGEKARSNRGSANGRPKAEAKAAEGRSRSRRVQAGKRKAGADKRSERRANEERERRKSA